MHLPALSAPLFLLLAIVAAPALASDCRHSAPRNLDLDLSGAKSVMFDVGPHELRVRASASGSRRISGRACASDADRLDSLTVTQQRDGDRVVVRLRREHEATGFGLGNRYAYLQLEADVPEDVLVQLDVGSGDAWLDGAAAASADVGSGDVELKATRGRATVKVGSGDIVIDGAGALKVLSIGSGDVEARNVRGDTEVGSIGSGEFSLRGGTGNVSIESIGSGDAGLADIGGGVRVGSIGSGDLEARGVGAGLTVSSVGSGSVRHDRVRGPVDVPRR